MQMGAYFLANLFKRAQIKITIISLINQKSAFIRESVSFINSKQNMVMKAIDVMRNDGNHKLLKRSVATYVY